MIGAKLTPDRAFAARLAQKAAVLARAALAGRRLASRSDPQRWRQPRLLWPLFTKD
jgi:hypothetical protein